MNFSKELLCSRMIILDDQARQQMTRHFLIVTSMQRFAHHRIHAYTAYRLTKPVMGEALH